MPAKCQGLPGKVGGTVATDCAFRLMSIVPWHQSRHARNILTPAGSLRQADQKEGSFRVVNRVSIDGTPWAAVRRNKLVCSVCTKAIKMEVIASRVAVGHIDKDAIFMQGLR